MDGAAIESFRNSLRGALLTPEDESYEEARRIWNGMIDRRPALIAQCEVTDDVVKSVDFARENGMLVSVRGGGHGAAGNAVCSDGLMVDLSAMKGIRVDPERRTAHVEPGVLLGDLDRETQAFELAVTTGIVSHTGVAGLTLGGGQGWLMGKHGLTIDNLLSVEMVLADGRVVTAGETENEDLFWAVRGAGANFGIVTSFEYRLHPQDPSILAGMMLYPMDQARDMLRFYRDYSINTPDELMAIAALLTLPNGMPGAAIVAAWLGPFSDGEEHMKQLRDFGTPLADLVGETSYCELQRQFDVAMPHGMCRYIKMGYVPELEDELVDVVVAHMKQKTSPFSAVLFNVMKGAACRVAPDATSFPHRDPQWHFEFAAQWSDADRAGEHMPWVRDFWDDAKPFTRGVGVNFLDADESVERLRTAYGSNYDRLLELKDKYDPTNFFRFNNNIVRASD